MAHKLCWARTHKKNGHKLLRTTAAAPACVIVAHMIFIDSEL